MERTELRRYNIMASSVRPAYDIRVSCFDIVTGEASQLWNCGASAGLSRLGLPRFSVETFANICIRAKIRAMETSKTIEANANRRFYRFRM